MRATSACRATASYESTISFWRSRELRPVAFCLGRDCSQSRGTRLLDLVNARPYDDWGSRPLTASAVAAEATTTLRLGSYVFCNEYRHPVILAREAATLDMLSEGRFELGPGAGERILKLAAREADIITIGSKITAQGLDPSDATLEQKIAWIKEAAGKRFVDLELSQTVYDLVFTDSGTAISHYGEGPPIPKQPVNTEQRDRYGFSYIQVYAGQMKNFTPVLSRLVGH